MNELFPLCFVQTQKERGGGKRLCHLSLVHCFYFSCILIFFFDFLFQCISRVFFSIKFVRPPDAIKRAHLRNLFYIKRSVLLRVPYRFFFCSLSNKSSSSSSSLPVGKFRLHPIDTCKSISCSKSSRTFHRSKLLMFLIFAF